MICRKDFFSVCMQRVGVCKCKWLRVVQGTQSSPLLLCAIGPGGPVQSSLPSSQIRSRPCDDATWAGPLRGNLYVGNSSAACCSIVPGTPVKRHRAGRSPSRQPPVNAVSKPPSQPSASRSGACARALRASCVSCAIFPGLVGLEHLRTARQQKETKAVQAGEVLRARQGPLGWG